MSDIYMNALREFHTKYNHYMAEVPHIPPDAILDLRRKLVDEEVRELHNAIGNLLMFTDFRATRELSIYHIVEVADALADSLYVVFGTALAYGIDIEKIFLEVHRSNMTKSMKKDEKSIPGKTLKGDDWSPPNLRQFIDTPNFGEE